MENCLQPILSPRAKRVVKSYGDWARFMRAFGLKPWDPEDNEEGRIIAESLGHDIDD